MRLRFDAGVVLLALAALGCGELEDIDAGVCGNGILEKGEDCDSPDDACGQPGDDAECRFIAVDGACPIGSASVAEQLGGDGVCRFAFGTYESSDSLPGGPNILVGLADFDGDFHPDAAALRPGDVAVHYLSDTASIISTATVPSDLGFPVVGALSDPEPGDSTDAPSLPPTAGFVLAEGGLSVVLGDAGRALAPKSYAPYPVSPDARHSVFAEVNPESIGEEILAVINLPAGGAALVDIYLQSLEPPRPLPGTQPPLVLGITAGNLDLSSPCDEIVLAEEGKATLSVLRMCEQGKYSPSAPVTLLQLPTGQTVVSGARLADLNGDLFLDLMVQASASGPLSARLLVAYGIGDGTFSSDPSLAAADNTLAPFHQPGAYLLDKAFPLAAGDVNGDKVPDFVLASFNIGSADDPDTVPGHVMVSGAPPGQEGCFGIGDQLSGKFPGLQAIPPGYACVAQGNWSEAVMGRLNGDDFPDVAAIGPGAPYLDFLVGTGTGIFNPAQLPTQAGGEKLLAGDFDGDLVTDLAFVEEGSAGDSVAVAFGKLVGPPEAPVRVGGLGKINVLGSGRVLAIPNEYDLISDLGVIAEDPVTGGQRAALLYGSTNRVFDAPFGIVEGEGKSQRFSPAARVLIGEFDGEPGAHGDLAVITARDVAADGQPISAAPPERIWLLPSSGDADLSNAEKQLSPQLEMRACTAAMTAADLDGDGRDEIVVLGAISQQGSVATVARRGATGFDLDPPQPLSEFYLDLFGTLMCADVPISPPDSSDLLFSLIISRPPRVVDLSGEVGVAARPDVLALAFVPAGESGDVSTKLVVFENDGQGGLDVPGRISLAMPPELAGQTVVSFDVLNADSDPQKEVVLVAVDLAGSNETSMYLAEMDLEAKALVPRFKFQSVAGPLSVITGDVDLDGVDDIVASTVYGIEVLRGKPRDP